jgi:hypothetical protein
VVDDAVAAVAVLLWVTTAAEAVHVLRKRPPDPALQALLLTFGFLAIAATLFVSAVQDWTWHATGVANISEPLARTALFGAAWSVQVLLLRLRAPDNAPTRARRRAAVVLVAVAALWVLFAVAPVHRQTHRFAGEYGADPVVAAYLAVSLAYLGYALVDVLRGVSRYAGSAPAPLAAGLRLIGLGCALGLGYVSIKTAFLLGLVSRHRLMTSSLESSVDRSLAVGGGVLVTLGSLLPFLADRANRVRSWGSAYISLRRLHPLWLLLYRATPGIALDPAASALSDALRLRDVELRLYRRVIEIRDGRLALVEYLDTAVAQDTRATAEAEGLPQEEADAMSEAALLLDAAKRKARSLPTDGSAPPSPDASETLADEVEWLLHVTGQLQRLLATGGVTTSESTSTPTPRTAP